MYCKNCGKEINDKAVICVNCGVPTGVSVNPSKSSEGLADDVVPGWLIAVCILIPIAGIIIGIIKCSEGSEIVGKKCIKYSVITWLICFAVIFISYSYINI